MGQNSQQLMKETNHHLVKLQKPFKLDANKASSVEIANVTNYIASMPVQDLVNEDYAIEVTLQ